MAPDEDHNQDEEREVRRRVALPLLIPITVFLFSLLVIYGLSRIYLEFDTYEIGDVSMATPLALGVSIAILLAAWFLASVPRLTRMHIVSVFALAAVLLTVGGIWAAVRDEGEVESVTANGDEDGTPAPEGAVLVNLVDPDWAVEVNPEATAAGSVTFSVTNAGSLIHNFRVISTDLDAGSLPVNDEFKVDESAVDVVGSAPEFPGGETQELTVDLEAGSYVLICNVAAHYDSGMFTAFTIE